MGVEKQLDRKIKIASSGIDRACIQFAYLSDIPDIDGAQQELAACILCYGDNIESAFRRLVHTELVSDIAGKERYKLVPHGIADLDCNGDYIGKEDCSLDWFASACLDLQSALASAMENASGLIVSKGELTEASIAIVRLLLSGSAPSVRRLESEGVRHRVARYALVVLDEVMILLDDGLIRDYLWALQRDDNCGLWVVAENELATRVSGRNTPNSDELEALASIGD
jgi:hypothetical protein